MSIKLHEGVRIKGLGLVELLPRLQELRRELLRISDELAVRYVLASACAHHDRLALGLPWPSISGEGDADMGITGSFLVQAQIRLMNKHLRIEQHQERAVALDFSASLCILPVQGELLAVPYIVNPVLRAAWAAQDWHEPYGYWDNTDPDPTLSAQDWAERESKWSQALEASDWLVGASSYVYEFSPVSGAGLAMAGEEHAHLIPTVAQRAKALAPYGYMVEAHLAREKGEPLQRKGRVADEPRVEELRLQYEKTLRPLGLRELMALPSA